MDSEEAIGLLRQEDVRANIAVDKERVHKSRSSTVGVSSSRWMTMLLTAVVLLDLAIYGYITHTLAKQRPTRNREPPPPIRNSYVGLDELYSTGQINASHHDPIINKPRRVGQVFKTNPKKTSPVDLHRWLTPYGTVAPPDEHLQVSSDTRTIIEFRAIDYGMESCQLALRLPRLNQRLAEPFRFHGVDDSVALDVCELDGDELIHLPALSWAHRPACRRVVGTFSGTPGHEVTLPRFPCKTRSLYSYEISCSPSNPDCLVDVWAGQNTTMGVFMYQHQTV